MVPPVRLILRVAQTRSFCFTASLRSQYQGIPSSLESTAQALVPHPVNHNQSAKGHADTYEIIMNGTGPSSFVGAIDQGTTSSRFLIFNNQGEVVVTHQLEFTQIYPRPGYVSLA